MRIKKSLALFSIAVSAVASAAEVSTLAELYDALEATSPDAEIIVDPGEYRLTKTLVVPAGVTLRSRDGRGSTFILQQAETDAQAFKSVNLQGAGSTIDGFTFKDIAYTWAANNGCVVYVTSGGSVRNCDILRCRNYSGYGVVYLAAGNTTVESCRIVDNTTVSGGSHGIAVFGGSVTITYTLVAGNRPVLPCVGNSLGPGLYFSAGAGSISHCTIVDNYSTTGGRGIGNNNRSVSVWNSIVLSSCIEPYARYNNGISDTNKKITFTNCFGIGLDAWSASSSGNIEGWDPKFVNPLLGDYRIQSGSPCIGAAGDGGDIGCFAADAGGMSVPVVPVPAGGDLAAAVASAQDGTEIRLAEGSYVVPTEIAVTNALRIVGAGRGRTFVRSDGTPHRLFKLSHFRASMESMTISGAVGTNLVGVAVRLDYGGGLLRDLRVTGCRSIYSGTINTSTVGVSTGGVIQDVVIDGNVHLASDLSASGFGAAGVAIDKGTASDTKYLEAHLLRCLVVHNTGNGFFGNNASAMGPTTQIRYCTFADNCKGYGFITSRSVTVQDSIVWSAYAFPAKAVSSFDPAAGSSVSRTLYYAISSGTQTDCQRADDPGFVDPVAGDYHLVAGSPAIGLAAGGTDAGALQYDGSYVPEDRTVPVPAGNDLSTAISSAASGSTLLLGAGTHYLSAPVTIDRPLRIVGAGGRDATIVEPTVELGASTLFTFSSDLAEMREITVRNVKGRAFYLGNGGFIEHCRVTDSAIDATWAGTGLGVYSQYGYVNRCQFDNISYNANRDMAIAEIRSNLTGQKPTFERGIMENSLVFRCSGLSGSKKKGYAVQLTRNNIGTGGVLRNCTVFDNDMAYGINASSYAESIVNSVITGSLSINAAVAARMSNNCLPQEWGADCVVAADPQLKSSGVPKASSPVVGMAQILRGADHVLDLAGKPRLARDGTQDIGCLQHAPPGLSILLR